MWWQEQKTEPQEVPKGFTEEGLWESVCGDPLRSLREEARMQPHGDRSQAWNVQHAGASKGMRQAGEGPLTMPKPNRPIPTLNATRSPAQEAEQGGVQAPLVHYYFI